MKFTGGGANLRVLDLFSGIGGFSLGLERAGMRTVAFCEIEPYCQAVLRKHWPDVPIFGDVRTLTANSLANAAPNRCRQGPQGRSDPSGARQSQSAFQVDVICGGFPCQDISIAGRGEGIEGERSGLWKEYARIIGELRPRFVIVENVSALLGRGLGRVLGDLAALGYDAEWHCIPASAIGAPHRRDRIWIVAHPSSEGWRSAGPAVTSEANGRWSLSELGGASEMADANEPGLERRNGGSLSERARQCSAWASRSLADTHSQPTQRFAISWGECSQWLAEPDVGRVANGISARMDRLRSLGNAVVPQIPEIIGRAIMLYEQERQ